MKIGTVTGKVRMGRRAECLLEETVLLVQMEGNDIAALDRAGAKPGDRVLVVMSHAAGRYSMAAPSDAVVVAVVESCVGTERAWDGTVRRGHDPAGQKRAD